MLYVSARKWYIIYQHTVILVGKIIIRFPFIPKRADWIKHIIRKSPLCETNASKVWYDLWLHKVQWFTFSRPKCIGPIDHFLHISYRVNQSGFEQIHGDKRTASYSSMHPAELSAIPIFSHHAFMASPIMYTTWIYVVLRTESNGN